MKNLIPYERQFFPSACIPYSMWEAVVKPKHYLFDIGKVISKHEKDFINIKNPERLCIKLSLLMRIHKIKFKYDKKATSETGIYFKFGFSGAKTTVDKYNTITIVLNQYILNIKNHEDFKIFYKYFLMVLEHELIHRGQFLHIKGEALKNSVIRGYDENDIEQYIDKKEIMAYAWTIIQEFKLMFNFDNNKIRGIIKTRPLVNVTFSPTLEFYRDITTKGKNSWVLKLLYKYMYLYLDGDENET